MQKLTKIPAGCELPQLHEIVDTKKLSETLYKYLSNSDTGIAKVAGCKINNLYYKPGGDCRVLFTADLQPEQNGENSEQLFFGRVFPSGKARAEFQSLKMDKLAAPKFGPPAMYIPEWETVLWAFPNDPKLPGLSMLMDANSVTEAMKAAPESFGMKTPPAKISARQTKYVPGRRCGFIFEAEFDNNGDAGAAGKHPVYGKAYQAGEGEKAYHIMKQIWDSDARNSDELLLPQPYSFDQENSIIWQEVVPGRPLAKIAPQLDNLAELAIEIGHRLAAYHNTSLDLATIMTLDFQLDDLRFSEEKINAAFPDFAADCSAVAQKLYRSAEALAQDFRTPVHASFKFSHIFIGERGVTFIDFDNANIGDPGYDLGRFIAHLYKMKNSGKIAQKTAEETVSNFCDAYNDAAKQTISRNHINWWAASHLVGSQVYKAVKRMNSRAVAGLLADANALCPA